MSKIFCDPVHGQMSLPSICVTIMDTPEFQRLRKIKQTGIMECVYPGSTHNRFAHSLGVCYLAGVFIQRLKTVQPELPISSSDILCVQIAGLCHDLGHGPFSHTWEFFMKESCNLRNDERTWKHENVSLNMFEYLIRTNDLLPQLEEHGIGRKEINNIKSMIIGKKIVNNEDSGLDVDKWDYFLRDCYYTGLPCSFKYQRLVYFSRVLPIEGRNEICFRDKVVQCVYNVFFTRSDLHRLAYQHRVYNILETMFVDALLKADGLLKTPSGKKLHLWKWSMDAAFSHGTELAATIKKFFTLDDYLILTSLRHTVDSRLKDSVFLMTAIEKRSCEHGLYKQIALRKSPIRLTKEILAEMAKLFPEANEEIYIATDFNQLGGLKNLIIPYPVTIEDIAIKVLSIHWGKKETDPVTSVHFYSKQHPFQVQSINHNHLSVNLPKTFEDIQVLVMCRRSDPFAAKVSKLCFEKYWKRFVKASMD